MARKEKKIIGWFPVTWTDKKKQKYTVQITDLDVTFDELKKRMEEIEAEYGSEFTKFKIEKKHNYGYGTDEWDEFHVYGWREETDQEFADRVGKADTLIKEREARELAEFERLKAKFGMK